MILISHHRSAKLAKRKLRKLQKENPRKIIKLFGRFNDDGDRSPRGHEFRWSIVPKRKSKKEYVVHFDYGSEADGSNLIRFQVHIFGPGTSTDARAVSAIKEIERGESPRGWEVKEIFWGHPFTEDEDVDGTDDDDVRNQLGAVRRATILGGAAKVRRKNTVRPDRRKRKRN